MEPNDANYHRFLPNFIGFKRPSILPLRKKKYLLIIYNFYFIFVEIVIYLHKYFYDSLYLDKKEIPENKLCNIVLKILCIQNMTLLNHIQTLSNTCILPQNIIIWWYWYTHHFLKECSTIYSKYFPILSDNNRKLWLLKKYVQKFFDSPPFKR